MRNNNDLKTTIQRIIDACAHTMNIQSVDVVTAEILRQQIMITVDKDRQISVAASSIYLLLSHALQTTAGFQEEPLWQPTSGTSVYGEITARTAEEHMLRLVELLVDAGELEEGKLCALQCVILEDYRKDDPTGRQLFGKSKLKSEKVAARSTSEASMVENLLPFVTSDDPCEIVFAVTNILLCAGEGFGHVKGKRRERMIVSLREAEAVLSRHQHSTIQSYGRLLSTARQVEKWFQD